MYASWAKYMLWEFISLDLCIYNTFLFKFCNCVHFSFYANCVESGTVWAPAIATYSFCQNILLFPDIMHTVSFCVGISDRNMWIICSFFQSVDVITYFSCTHRTTKYCKDVYNWMSTFWMQTDGFQIFHSSLLGYLSVKFCLTSINLIFLCHWSISSKEIYKLILKIHRSNQNDLSWISHSNLFKNFEEHGTYKKYLFYFRNF